MRPVSPALLRWIRSPRRRPTRVALRWLSGAYSGAPAQVADEIKRFGAMEPHPQSISQVLSCTDSAQLWEFVKEEWRVLICLENVIRAIENQLGDVHFGTVELFPAGDLCSSWILEACLSQLCFADPFTTPFVHISNL